MYGAVLMDSDTRNNEGKSGRRRDSVSTTPRMFSTNTEQTGAQIDTAREKHSKSSQPRVFHRKSLSGWDFMETVGAGSMGKVKLAKNKNSNEVCAIKIVHRATKAYMHKAQQLPPPADENEAKERQKRLNKEISRDKRTVREASLGQILFHPNVCKLYEMQTLSNHYYMFFEFISGGQLLDYIIQHGSLKENHARKVSRGILSALQYLHANNIVHRDLKIENIMLSKTGEIKLIDFGLSNMYDPRKSLQTFCGSLYFAAPELLKAHPYLGPEVDVWSFGVVLYVLVCGKVPFDDENSSALHEKIKKGKVTYPQFLSIDVISLLSKILVVDPQKRATLQQVVNHQWMLKGYDFPPQSYLPRRVPLTVDDINIDVIKEMYRFEFVESIDAAYKTIIDIITEPEYKQLADQYWELADKSSFSEDSKFFTDDFKDPTQAYHPLISLYYLTFEKMQRDAKKENKDWLSTKSSEITNSDVGLNKEYKFTPKKMESIQKEPNPSELLEEQGNVTPEDISPQISNDKEQSPIAGQSGSKAPRSSIKALTNRADQSAQVGKNAGISPKPSVENTEKSGFTNIFRRFSQRHQRPSNINNSMASKNNNIRTHTRAVSDYMSVAPNELQKPVEIVSQNLPDLPTDAKLIIEKTRNSSKNKSDENETLQPVPHAKGKKLHPTARAKSVGHARRESLNFTRPAVVPPNMADIEEVVDTGFLQTPDEEKLVKDKAFGEALSNTIVEDLTDDEILKEASKAPPGSMPSIDYPRTLFLKGFFSVQTTSSKPLPIVRYKIISVLKKNNIEFVEVKGGFVCSKSPTVTILNTKTAPEKVDVYSGYDNDDTPDWSSQQSPKSMNDARLVFSDLDKSSNPHLTEGHSNSSLNDFENDNLSVGGKGDYLDNIQGPRAKVMDRAPIKFEIHIVRVRIVGLAGIHFKKLSGNTWMYKELATRILHDLKL
ncbi:hypothetical protein B1J92_B01925g [Nakaseomyces glabratus]|nr:hypothetical protein B1J91_B01925g [Nakaseomyces glabratus]OXB50429.1 hypothetical protein B1J92_B01925g [Nakaseomyces glabratus]